MCGRFVVIFDPKTQRFIKRFVSYGKPLPTSYNIAPTQTIPTICRFSDTYELHDMRWWLVPSWSDGPTNKYAMFNARAESLHKSPAFKLPFKQQRCIIPATGYYEWQKVNDRKLPTYITPASGVFAFAGLYDHWSGQGEDIWSCTVVTTQAHDKIRHIHNRMPVMLDKKGISSWLAKETPMQEINGLLQPSLPEDLQLVPVSTYVNNARHNDERCITPIAPPQWAKKD